MVVIDGKIRGQIFGGTGDFQKRGSPPGLRLARRSSFQIRERLLYQPQFDRVELWKLGYNFQRAHGGKMQRFLDAVNS
jgi:hypothetical protein